MVVLVVLVVEDNLLLVLPTVSLEVLVVQGFLVKEITVVKVVEYLVLNHKQVVVEAVQEVLEATQMLRLLLALVG